MMTLACVLYMLRLHPNYIPLAGVDFLVQEVIPVYEYVDIPNDFAYILTYALAKVKSSIFLVALQEEDEEEKK